MEDENEGSMTRSLGLTKGPGAQFAKGFGEHLEKENAKRAAIRSLSDEVLEDRFYSKDITDEQRDEIARLRLKFWEMAWFIDTYVPNGRQKSIALTELESACHWAVKAISHNPKIQGDEDE